MIKGCFHLYPKRNYWILHQKFNHIIWISRQTNYKRLTYMFDSEVDGTFSLVRCSFKHPSIFLISLKSICRPAGTCLHVDNCYLSCQPHLTKKPLRVSQSSWRQCATSLSIIPDSFNYDHPAQRTVASWHRKRRRWGRKRGMAAQMYNSFIHHFSPFSSHYSPPQKKSVLNFFCLHKCHPCKRDWDTAGAKGHIFSLNFDFLHSFQKGQMKWVLNSK